jgi:AraC family transcriptional activator of pobA
MTENRLTVHQNISLRYASDFAEKLNVHVNHLNRAIKETTYKTTSQIIAERIFKRSKNALDANCLDGI